MELLGLILGLGALIFLSFKGWTAIPSTIVAVVILALTNGINIIDAVFVKYVGGVANFVSMSFLVFVAGSLYGKVMGDSKATVTIAYKLLDVVGKEKVILVLLLSSAILTYVGVNAFVLIFSMYPIIVALCSEAKVPKRLALACIMAASSTFTPLLPGNATNFHVILASAVGASVTDAPIWGIAGTIVIFTLTYIYLSNEQKKATKNGEVFVEGNSAFGKMDLSSEDLPGLGVSLLPMIVLLGIIFGSSKFLAPMTAVVIALLSGALVAFVLFYKRLPNKIQILNQGINSSINPLINVGAIVGFSSVVQSLSVFGSLIEYVLSINVNPLVLLVLVMGVLSIITANALGSVAFFTNTMASRFLELGMDPGLLLRFGLMGANTTAVMPHCGGMIAVFGVTGTNHKESYKDMFMVGVVIPTIGAIIMLGFALIFA